MSEHGWILAGLVLGERAMEAARAEALAPDTREIMAAARRYAEGTGFRLPVVGPGDLDDLRTLVGITLRF